MKPWFENKTDRYRHRKMKVAQSSKNLFWLNFAAMLQMTLGVILLLVSLVLIAFDKLLISLIPIIAGVFLIIKGKIARLDYKRKSGYIIYGG